MKSTAHRIVLGLAASVLGLTISLAGADEEYSHARIVRLSFVEGAVTVMRPGSDWAVAPVNTPIQEGFQLLTDKNSFVEVQFENGSTARVGELSLLKFDELALTESGDSLNRLVLDHGYGTFHALPEKLGVFEVQSGDATFKPQGNSEFRVDLEQGRARAEVFKGSVEVTSPQITTTLAKGGVLEITPGSEEAYNLTQGARRDDWDDWVAERDQQESAATPPGGEIQGAPAYGWSDLNQYGSWSHFDNYGYGWVPDAASAWSPFGFGQWSWYPTMGYTWTSYEPWGWLPYHFGGWSFDPLFGWAWFPGSSWGWSPGTVNWYQGPGWVGWAPQAPGGGNSTGGGAGAGHLPHPKPCPPGAPSCMKVIKTTALQRGGPILGREFLRVQPSEGRLVQTPDVEPGFGAQLPGKPARLSTAQQAVLSGTVNSGGFMARFSPASHEWVHRAPEFRVSAPPAEVRREAGSFWATGRNGGASNAREGGYVREGGYSSVRSGGFSAGQSSGASSHAGGASAAGGGGSHASGGGSHH